MAEGTRIEHGWSLDNGDTASGPIHLDYAVYHDYGSQGSTFQLMNEGSTATYIPSTKADSGLGPILHPLPSVVSDGLKAVLVDGKLDVFYK